MHTVMLCFLVSFPVCVYQYGHVKAILGKRDAFDPSGCNMLSGWISSLRRTNLWVMAKLLNGSLAGRGGSGLKPILQDSQIWGAVCVKIHS